MKIYLDDVRQTPEGYKRTYSVEETVSLIKENDGNVETISLDNDLGIGYKEGKEVLQWLEEQAYNNSIYPIPNIIIHTSNTCAESHMMMIRYNIWKYWESHGWNRIKVWQETEYTD